MEGDVEIEVEILRMSPKAMFVATKDHKRRPIEAWIPLSQIRETDCLAEGDQGTMTISKWIAAEKEIIEKKDEPPRYTKRRK